MRVSEIWRYPVKSVGGERLEFVDVDELGIAGDRQWGILDPATGLVLTARREPNLLFLSARVVDGRPEITDTDGTALRDDAALSAALGHPVRLVTAGDGPGTFENPLDVEREADWSEWESSGGTLHDGRSKISFVSRGSFGDWDARRFRLNVILDADADERELAGSLDVGTARFMIRKPIERCIMVTRAQPGLERDLSVLKRIIAERDNQLGIGAVVARPGRIAVGDTVA